MYIHCPIHDLQKKAAKRGSGSISIKDIGRLDELVDSAGNLKAEAGEISGPEGEEVRSSVDDLAEKIEKLRKKVAEEQEDEDPRER